MFSVLAGFIIRQRRVVVIAIALLTVFFGAQIRNLSIVINPNTMLPQSHPNVIGTNLAETLFGSKHVVVVGLSDPSGGTALQPSVLTSLARLTTDLSAIHGVKRYTMMGLASDKAKSITGNGDEMIVDPLLPLPVTATGIAALERKLILNPIYEGLLVSQDRKTVTLTFAVSAGAGGFREIMDKVHERLDKERATGVVINASGAPVFFAAVERFAQRMGFLFPLAILLIAIIHYEAFRTIQGLVLPLVTAILAVVWGLGIMGAFKVPMDAFNATTPILILAVAAGHAVQILKRYYEEFELKSSQMSGSSPDVINDLAIASSLEKVAPVMITAGLVAAAGFFSLLTFDVATIRTFGVFTGLGILSALLIELTFIPALRSYLPPPKQSALRVKGYEDRLWDRLADSLADVVISRRSWIIVGFAVFSLLGIAGMTNINRENSTKSYFGDSLAVREQDRVLNASLAGTNTLYVVFQGDRPDRMKDPKVLELIEDTQRFLAQKQDVGKTVSIVDFVKQMNRSMNGGKSEYYVIPKSGDAVSQFLLMYSMSGQPTDFDAYIDYEYRNANITVWTKNDSSKYAAQIVGEIRSFLSPRLPEGVTFQVGGSVPQSSALSETLVEGKIRNIAQMMVVVFIAGIVIFGSVMAGVYLILPLIVTVLANFGLMGLTGIPLNTPNAVASAMAIGIGADYAIYLLYRMREELERVGDFDRALRTNMRTAGKAVVYVSTAIAGGYSVLMLSFNFYVHIWFGILIVMSMLVSAVAALVLMPSLLKAFPPQFLYKKSQSRVDSLGVARMLMGTSVLLLLALSPRGPALAEEPLATLMEKNYQATRVQASVSEATFRLISQGGQERMRKTFAATKLKADGLSNRRVIRFLSPSDVRNTTTLLVENPGEEDEILVYLPSLKKARRLASNNKKGSFVGSDLSYGDIVGHKPRDWVHKLLHVENLNGTAMQVIESTPKDQNIAEASGYTKRVSWISQDTALTFKTEFYDLSGSLLKTADYSDYKIVTPQVKRWQAFTVRVKNHQTGHTTVVTLDRFEATGEVSDDYFNRRYVEKEE